MKNLKYILIPALTGFLFTACSTEPVGPSAAELDTQVEAKVKSATDQLKAECDSRLMQAAQLKADSVLAKVKNVAPKPAAPAPKAPVTPKTPPKAPVKAPTPPAQPAPPKNPKADRFDTKGGKKTVTEENTKQKADRFDGGEKKTVTPEDTKRKEDRFK